MKLELRLQDYGLHLRGVASLTGAEMSDYGFDEDRQSIALVGNIGSSYWPIFSESAEYLDGRPDALDRWSRSIAESIASEFPLTPVYPFEGPPYYPFQQWAQRAEALEQSPIGVMMHPEFGLWHSYRFALVGAEFDDEPASNSALSPCVDCTDKPCLQRCPVGAFDTTGYDVDACAGYLKQNPLAQCHALGCLARYSCPVAPDLRYLPAQGRFHLQAFLEARR